MNVLVVEACIVVSFVDKMTKTMTLCVIFYLDYTNILIKQGQSFLIYPLTKQLIVPNKKDVIRFKWPMKGQYTFWIGQLQRISLVICIIWRHFLLKAAFLFLTCHLHLFWDIIVLVKIIYLDFWFKCYWRYDIALKNWLIL